MSENLAPKNKGGRPPGSLNKRTKELIAKAESTGLLPHEILLEVARGKPLEEWHVHPQTGDRVRVWTRPADLTERLQAARDAAPYYAPKLQTVEVIQGLTDDSLDSLIAQLAAEAGVGLTPDGEGEEDPPEDTGGAGPRPRRRIRQEG